MRVAVGQAAIGAAAAAAALAQEPASSAAVVARFGGVGQLRLRLFGVVVYAVHVGRRFGGAT